MKKVALILAGCGFQDGSEVHESVLCLLALQQAACQVQCFAPDIPQAKVVNHLTGEEVNESRNVLVESARIARGKIKSLEQLDVDAFDAVLIPGGFGVALNLSNFATKGTGCDVNPKLHQVVLSFYEQKKPIGATCISPAVLAKIFEGKQTVTMTLGQGEGPLHQLEEMGMQPKAASSSQMVADEQNKVYTTPCYMEPPDLPGMYEGVKKVVAKLVQG